MESFASLGFKTHVVEADWTAFVRIGACPVLVNTRRESADDASRYGARLDLPQGVAQREQTFI
jgi:hypothetical protein